MVILKSGLRQLVYSGFLVPKRLVVTLCKAPFWCNISYVALQLKLH